MLLTELLLIQIPRRGEPPTNEPSSRTQQISAPPRRPDHPELSLTKAAYGCPNGAVPSGTLALVTARACSTSKEITVNPDAIVIDVRTAEEYADGHLENAQLLDIMNGEFGNALPSLDRSAEYLLYCRSGNRSGHAMNIMQQAGFASVANLGSVAEASTATGIDITR